MASGSHFSAGGIGLISAEPIAGAMSNLGPNGIAILLARLPDADLLAQSFAAGDLFGGEFGGDPGA